MLARNQPHKLPDTAYDAHAKSLVLLQCHFSRKAIPADLRPDQKLILKDALKLIQAIVDVISSNGWLKPALAAMELSQMIVQGLWNKDHPLKQVSSAIIGLVQPRWFFLTHFFLPLIDPTLHRRDY
jgi:pre-mRNA-splicing helicase BRR2